MSNFCFVHENLPASDIELFFGSIKADDVVVRFDDRAIMANLIAQAGIFNSVTQARKNGWDKPIPPGFQHLILTKRKVSVAILNVFPGSDA